MSRAEGREFCRQALRDPAAEREGLSPRFCPRAMLKCSPVVLRNSGFAGFMFTGIITDIGVLEAVEGACLTVACRYSAESIALGASIAHDGCCLTVTKVTAQPEGGARYQVDVSNETRSKTTLGDWTPGRRINLERALGLGEELGGHLVTGHVDGVARVLARRADGNASRFVIEAPQALAKFIAPKGSVALNGTSLTVNEVDGARFGVSLIPHTLQQTTWSEIAAGDKINLEVDLLARYVARIQEVATWETP